MKLRLFASTLVVGFAMTAAAAPACPCRKSAPVTKVKTVAAKAAVTVAAKPCCAKSAVTVADKAADGGSETVKTVKSAKKGGCTHPCGAAKAVTVSDKAPCGKPCGAAKAAKASAKSPCGQPCGGAKAVTVSDKAPCGKPCDAKTASASGNGDCPVAKKVSAVLASMPSMRYRVGEEVTGCSKSAAAMAEKARTSVTYVVGDETFKSEGEATVKLASLLETELNNLQAVQYVAAGKCMRCPITAKSVAKVAGSKVTYRIGGVDFENEADAKKVAELVSDAVASVSMKYKVGEKSFRCDKMADAAAKDKGAKITYVVGDQETSCSVSAKAMLTRAKARRAVETAVKSSLSL